MPAIIQLTGAKGQRRVTFTVDDAQAAKPAIDFVFDVLGAQPVESLAEAGIVPDSDLPDLRVLQGLVFDKDDEGFFIRDGAEFFAAGGPLDPDAPLTAALTRIDQGGASYGRCDLTVRSPLDAGLAQKPAPPGPVQQVTPAAPVQSIEAQMKTFDMMLFLHRIALGEVIDVTKDHIDLEAVLADAEGRLPPLVEIDVKKAIYALSEEGKRFHKALMSEAQELVKRYDIYGDVDLDASGTARFDTGLGQDWRVPAFELAGIDPFKARFLLGLNDREWDHLPDWTAKLGNAEWYGSLFEPIEQAPSLEQVGREKLRHVMDQARNALRSDGVFLENS